MLTKCKAFQEALIHKIALLKYKITEFNKQKCSENEIKNDLPCYLTPGLKGTNFIRLKNLASSLNESDRNCVLIFDESPLRTEISYQSGADRAVGFRDLGDGRSDQDRYPTPATGYPAVMARGLCSDFKALVGVAFIGRHIHWKIIAGFLERALEACQKAELKVRAIVCDQSSTIQSSSNYSGQR